MDDEQLDEHFREECQQTEAEERSLKFHLNKSDAIIFEELCKGCTKTMECFHALMKKRQRERSTSGWTLHNLDHK